MSNATQNKAKYGKAGSIALCALLFVSACGLGMDTDARLERAQQAYDSGEYRAAIIDTKNILQKEPENVAARLLLGRSSVRVGDPRAAEKELRRAVELGTDKGEVIVDLGRALLMLGEFEQIEAEITTDLAVDDEARLAILRIRGDALLAQARSVEARDLYLEILAERGDDFDTMIAVVRSYVVDKELMQARATLDEIIAHDAEYIPMWLTSGWLWALQQNFGQSEVDFNKAAELAVRDNDLPSQVKAMIGAGEAQFAQKKLEAAKHTVADLTELAPDNLLVKFLAARLSYLEEDWTAATEQLQNILRQNPNFVQAQVLLGAVHLYRGNLGQAETYLSTAVGAMPANQNARKLLAEARLQQNRAEAAAEVLQPLVTGESADPGALAMAARASIGAGEFEEAIRYLKMRADAEPDNSSLQMDLAAAHLSMGEIDEAQEILQSLPALSDDTSYRREFLLVLTAVRNGDYEQALGAARQMQDQWPDDARLYNLIGGILITTGDRDAARQSFDGARAADPSDAVSLISLARLDVAEKDFESAHERYAKALEMQPDNVGIMVSLGQVAAYKGDSEAAVRWLEKAKDADETDIVARAILGKAYVANKDYVAAEQVMREAIDLSKETADLHNTLGLAISGNGDHEAAAQSFAMAMELKPSEPVYSLNLAREYIIREEDERAEEVLRESLQSNPDHIPTSVMLASLYARAGDVDRAIRTARTLLQHSPDTIGPKVLLAELLYSNKEYDEASGLYDEALELSDNRDLAVRAYRLRADSGLATPEAPLLSYLSARPADSDVRMILAQDYQARGNNDGAVVAYEKVVATAADNHVALNNLAWIYFTQGNAQAEALARQANELAPDNGSVVDTLGWILLKTGSVDEGVEYLRKAVDLSDGEAEIRYHLAVGLAEAGAIDEARSLLDEILSPEEDFPSRGDAEALLGDL